MKEKYRSSVKQSSTQFEHLYHKVFRGCLWESSHGIKISIVLRLAKDSHYIVKDWPHPRPKSVNHVPLLGISCVKMCKCVPVVNLQKILNTHEQNWQLFYYLQIRFPRVSEVETNEDNVNILECCARNVFQVIYKNFLGNEQYLNYA